MGSTINIRCISLAMYFVNIVGLSKSQTDNMSYGSTSHYLRQLVGTEKAGQRPRTEKGKYHAVEIEFWPKSRLSKLNRQYDFQLVHTQ